MRDQVEQFRRESKRAGLGTTGRRYPEELRELAVEAWRLGAADGLTRREVAEELGVGDPTLERWVTKSGRHGARAAELCEVVVASPVGGPVALVTPGGYRVEGLSLADLRELLAGLR